MTTFSLAAFADEAGPALETQLDALAEHGISHIELRNINGRSVVEHRPAEIRRIRRRLEQRGIRVSALGSPLGKIPVTDDFAPQLQLFRQTLEIARLLETDLVRMFSFRLPGGADPAEHRDEVMRRWEKFLTAAQGTAVILLHENGEHLYGDAPQRCLDLLETFKSSQLRAIFDPGSFVQCGYEPFPAAYDKLKGYIHYLHVKDARFSDRKVVPAGKGDSRMAELLAALRRDGFRGFLSLEPHLKNYDETADFPAGSPWLERAAAERKFAAAVNALKDLLGETGQRPSRNFQTAGSTRAPSARARARSARADS